MARPADVDPVDEFGKFLVAFRKSLPFAGLFPEEEAAPVASPPPPRAPDLTDEVLWGARMAQTRSVGRSRKSTFLTDGQARDGGLSFGKKTLLTGAPTLPAMPLLMGKGGL